VVGSDLPRYNYNDNNISQTTQLSRVAVSPRTMRYIESLSFADQQQYLANLADSYKNNNNESNNFFLSRTIKVVLLEEETTMNQTISIKNVVE